MIKLTKNALIIGLLPLMMVVIPAQAEQKIAVVQDQLILENCAYGKDINKKIQAALNTRQNDLATREEAMQKKREAFQRDEVILSEKDRTDRKQEIAKLQRDLQGLADQYEMEMQDLNQSEFQAFRKLVMEELGNISKVEKVDLVIPQHIAYYSDKNMDLTDKVIEALDKRYKVSPSVKDTKKSDKKAGK